MKRLLLPLVLFFCLVLAASTVSATPTETTKINLAEIWDYDLLVEFEYTADGQNHDVSLNQTIDRVNVVVFMDESYASNWLYATLYNSVDLDIYDPSDSEIYNDTRSGIAVDMGDYFMIVIAFTFDDITLSASGTYTSVLNYSVYTEGAWESIDVWECDLTTPGGGPGPGGPTTGDDFMAWFNAGGLVAILSLCGFFGLILGPALFIYAAKTGSDSKFNLLVYFIMAMLFFFVLFLIGI